MDENLVDEVRSALDGAAQALLKVDKGLDTASDYWERVAIFDARRHLEKRIEVLRNFLAEMIGVS